MVIATTNPATGLVEKEFVEASRFEIDRALDRAVLAQSALRCWSVSERAAVLTRAAAILESDTDRFALLITREMGRPITAARAEVLKCARGLRYYADHGAEFLAPLPADHAAVGAGAAEIRWDPLGVVLAVMPWNYPFWQVIRFAAPALVSGNAGVLKHASNVPQCALAIEDLFREAGAPEGAFETLLVGAAAVADLVADTRISAVTLTGSEGAGRSVAAVAGANVKKSVLELGGSDAFIVLPSADVELAAKVAAASRTQNAGQSCISAKRFIVHQEVVADFTARFTEAMAAVATGDPLDETTEMGPVAVEPALRELQSLVDDALDHGATSELGGRIPDGPGWHYPPTVLSGITPDMRLAREEAFGPVAAVMTARDLDDAIGIANATDFGLSSSAWTSVDHERETLVSRLDAGAVFVNGMTASHPELPFGGIKRSGYGRELSFFGVREFCNAKTIWIAEEAHA